MTGGGFVKKIAILGGSTTTSVREMLELFLLGHGIRAEFYESEYAQWFQDAMFGKELRQFAPDIVFIHTSFRNIVALPAMSDDPPAIDAKLDTEFAHFRAAWGKLTSDLKCPIIQNNMERPIWRLMGNRDAWDLRGMTSFTARLNQKFCEYARNHDDFYINDLDYLAAQYGLDKWHDAYYWHMFKYALAVPAIPSLAFSVANIIKSIYGKNKKALVLDLDNTLWGGVVGDDGVDGIAIGPEVPTGQAYAEFQSYIRAHKDIGIILNVSSKNGHENAIAGLNHPDGILRPNDFAIIMANWDNKDLNIRKIATTLNIGMDSLVFVDDNPAERAIVRDQIPGIAVPEANNVEEYIRTLDNSGFFETTILTAEDAQKSEMYAENARRAELEESIGDYEAFLKSLEMKATIHDFEPIYMSRIAQLTNKSNQFNLTTRRYSESDIAEVAASPDHIRMYGKLTDKFGDNGLVTVVIGRKNGAILDMELWLMSCRVLKRGMEDAMLDVLVERARADGITVIKGHYYPTAKNGMVADFYSRMGFAKSGEPKSDHTEWVLDTALYIPHNPHMEIIKE